MATRSGADLSYLRQPGGRNPSGQVAKGANGKPLTDAQKRRFMSRYNSAFGTSINNMGQFDAAMSGTRDTSKMTSSQRRVYNSLKSSYGGSS